MHQSSLVVPVRGPRASLAAVLGEQTGRQNLGIHRLSSALTRTTPFSSIVTQNCRKLLSLCLSTGDSQIIKVKLWRARQTQLSAFLPLLKGTD